MELRVLKEFLEENRFYTVYQNESSKIEFPNLEVLLEDEKSGNYLLQIAYLPEIEKEIDHLSLMQFFVPVIDFDNNIPHDFSMNLHNININLPLPAFSIDTNAGLIYYRYTMPIYDSIDEATLKNQIIEVVYLIFYIVSQFSPVIKNEFSRTKEIE